MNSFKTRSRAKRNVLTVIFTFIPLFALAFLGLKVAVVTWLFFEGVLALVFCICLLLVAKTHWEIEFRDAHILLYNTGNHQSYSLDDLTRSDLIIKQSDAQKQKNTCDLTFKDMPFRLYDVACHNEMVTYIQEHFPA